MLGRDFAADGPWQKMSTDVTEFRLSFGKAYLAPVYDFGSKEIVAAQSPAHPDLAQQRELPRDADGRSPRAQGPIYLRHGLAVPARDLRLGARRAASSDMSRKGNC